MELWIVYICMKKALWIKDTERSGVAIKYKGHIKLSHDCTNIWVQLLEMFNKKVYTTISLLLYTPNKKDKDTGWV